MMQGSDCIKKIWKIFFNIIVVQKIKGLLALAFTAML